MDMQQGLAMNPFRNFGIKVGGFSIQIFCKNWAWHVMAHSPTIQKSQAPQCSPRLAPRRNNGSTKKQQRNNPSNADSETFRTAPKVFGRQQCAINGAGQQEGTSRQ